MNALLQQFLSESRDFLQGISEKLMQLETDPTSTELMVELFRFVHTLKGNSGLFDFPEMTRVLHASEDLMDSVRNGQIAYSQALADHLLEAMDFVSILMDEIENTGELSHQYADTSAVLAKTLRDLISHATPHNSNETFEIISENDDVELQQVFVFPTFSLPNEAAQSLYLETINGRSITFLQYTPDSECFFKGEDPFYLVRQIPHVFWKKVTSLNTAPLTEMDAYSCQLVFHILTTETLEELHELFRYVPEQVHFEPFSIENCIVPDGEKISEPLYDDFISEALNLLNSQALENLQRLTNTLLELTSPELWGASALRWLLFVLEHDAKNIALQRALILSLNTFSIEFESVEIAETINQNTQIVDNDVIKDVEKQAVALSHDAQLHLNTIIDSQRAILNLPNTNTSWLKGRLKAVSASLKACCQSLQKEAVLKTLENATQEALNQQSSEPLLVWLETSIDELENFVELPESVIEIQLPPEPKPIALKAPMANEISANTTTTDTIPEIKFNRRAEDNAINTKTLKVDQEKIDRLMNLIGEMVVAKNALPYLANRAESVFGVRELSREIKAQYAVINRVAEEMQDTIMQVRMMPVSFIFQRFPRMVRDISRKLGKEVNLILEGETTEADKNIIEALADPLIHIVRNSLDHGLELPDVRKAAGKSIEGTLIIRASQESDRVVIEIIDDGKGIDPDVIKNKAYEKGLIDETTLERISDKEAVNLVFAAGFSTADVISDLSGRGVGMDVVRSAVERVNGTVGIESEVGKGTRLFLSLPLSMAVTNVMIIESNQQIFGVPMDMVVETVRVPFQQIRTIKHKQTTVLRGRIVPLLSLNELLAQNKAQIANEDDEYATLIIRVHGENVGILVDDFRETVDIILKPMTGIFGGLSGYSGAALLGDGSVLMVLNPRELI